MKRIRTWVRQRKHSKDSKTSKEERDKEKQEKQTSQMYVKTADSTTVVLDVVLSQKVKK